MSTVWVVVQDMIVVGVYATEQLARLAADHPYAPLAVYEFELVVPREVSS